MLDNIMAGRTLKMRRGLSSGRRCTGTRAARGDQAPRGGLERTIVGHDAVHVPGQLVPAVDPECGHCDGGRYSCALGATTGAARARLYLDRSDSGAGLCGCRYPCGDHGAAAGPACLAVRQADQCRLGHAGVGGHSRHHRRDDPACLHHRALCAAPSGQSGADHPVHGDTRAGLRAGGRRRYDLGLGRQEGRCGAAGGSQ